MTRNPAMVNSPEHRQLAYKAATEGIVLLKNNGDVLPLDRQMIKSIAVIGEPARHLQIDALGSPGVQPLKSVEILDGLKAEGGDSLAVRYVLAGTDGNLLAGSALTVPGKPGVQGFQAEYYSNPNLTGNPAVVRVDNEINILNAASPAPGISGESYSARWSAQLLAPVTGTYTFGFRGDDGFRVFVDGKLVVDDWNQRLGQNEAGDNCFGSGENLRCAH